MSNENRNNRVSRKSTDVECNIGDAIEAAIGFKEIDTPVILHITHFRKRFADPDGLCVKWVIDGLVKNKILKDDNATIIKEIRQKQIKSTEERTLIKIEICED